MKYLISKKDQEFKGQVESCNFPVAQFVHRAHLRLAYVYLAENDVNASIHLMKNTLTDLLMHAGIAPSQKYHETLTASWVLAIYHFMNNMEKSDSADEFIDKNTIMLDSKIMMSHYSPELLFSKVARKFFVEPNLAPIPRYA